MQHKQQVTSPPKQPPLSAKFMKIAYIVSSSFSGSTLLSLLLNAHPSIGTISEFDRMDTIRSDPEYKCSCGSKIRECPFFIEIQNRMRNNGIEFEIDDMDLMFRFLKNDWMNYILTEKLPCFQSNTLEYVREKFLSLFPTYRRLKERFYIRNQAFMSSVLDVCGASIFLDANKTPYRMKLLNDKYDVKPIYLIKNGIAGTYSFIKDALRKGKKISVEEAAKKWFSEQLTILRILNTLPRDSYLIQGYSDLCRDPDASLEKIYHFLGVPPVPASRFRQVTHHVIGNNMRVEGITEIKERKDWEKLDARERAAYENIRRRFIGKLARLDPRIGEIIWSATQ